MTSEHKAIAELAFTLGARFEERRFDDHSASLEQWSSLAEVGFTGLSLPEEHGGAGGMLELCLASERLAAGGYPAGKLVISTAIAGSIVARHGTDPQRANWLPGIADGTGRFCFAFTEPGAGSNANRLATTVVRRGGEWRLNGHKTYISALESSEWMIVVARAADDGGLAVLVLPVPCDGVAATRVEVEAPAFEHQWSVWFDDVPVPEDAFLGAPGRGGTVLFDGLNPERLVIASQAVGVGRWCLARATAYAREREVFGAPIGSHQAVQHPLAEALVRLEGAWALVEIAGRAHDEGGHAAVAANIAKVAACDAGLFAADRALQTFGGSGFTDETLMLQRFVYLRLLQTVPVTRELALNHIATAGLGLPRSY